MRRSCLGRNGRFAKVVGGGGRPSRSPRMGLKKRTGDTKKDEMCNRKKNTVKRWDREMRSEGSDDSASDGV